MQIVILSGGLAKRLRPISKTTPKALIEINGVPFIEYQFRYLEKQGITKVVLCLGYLGDKIKNYLSQNKYSFDIEYSYDGSSLLGTGGAIKNAIKHIDNVFFVMYGDSFLPIDFKPVYQKFIINNHSALMTIINNHNKWDKSNVIFRNNIIKLYDKFENHEDMDYIDYGLSIFKKEVFLNILEKKFDLANIFNSLSISNDLDSYCVNERFFEIGTNQGILDFEEFLKKN